MNNENNDHIKILKGERLFHKRTNFALPIFYHVSVFTLQPIRSFLDKSTNLMTVSSFCDSVVFSSQNESPTKKAS